MAGLPLQASAQTRHTCGQELARAQIKDRQGNFEEAAALLTDCLNRAALSDAERVEALHLLTLAYIHNGYLGWAKRTVRQLLGIAPDYVPEPNQEPPYQRYSDSYAALVVSVRESMGQSPPLATNGELSGMSTPPKQETWQQVMARSQPSTAERFRNAEEAYMAGRYQEAIKQVREILRKQDLTLIEQVEAYRIEALSYLMQREKGAARRAVTQLVSIYPEYKPDASEPADYVALVEDVREYYLSGEMHAATRRKQRLIQLGYWTAGITLSGLVIGLVVWDFMGPQETGGN